MIDSCGTVHCYHMDKGFIVGWQHDLVNTKEIVLSVCDKPYHTNKRIVQKG